MSTLTYQYQYWTDEKTLMREYGKVVGKVPMMIRDVEKLAIAWRRGGNVRREAKNAVTSMYAVLAPFSNHLPDLGEIQKAIDRLKMED